MEIRHERDGDGGTFYVGDAGEPDAELTYSREGVVVVVRHTGVREKLEGKGVGRSLVEEVVRWARAEGLRVRPVCSFARAVFDRTPEYGDVRA